MVFWLYTVDCFAASHHVSYMTYYLMIIIIWVCVYSWTSYAARLIYTRTRGPQDDGHNQIQFLLQRAFVNCIMLGQDFRIRMNQRRLIFSAVLFSLSSSFFFVGKKWKKKSIRPEKKEKNIFAVFTQSIYLFERKKTLGHPPACLPPIWFPLILCCSTINADNSRSVL